jgi:hypothetical protein
LDVGVGRHLGDRHRFAVAGQRFQCGPQSTHPGPLMHADADPKGRRRRYHRDLLTPVPLRRARTPSAPPPRRVPPPSFRGFLTSSYARLQSFPARLRVLVSAQMNRPATRERVAGRP